jgi:hypothetical protein
LDKIKWLTTHVLVRDLQEYQDNPRRISKRDFDKLVKSIEEDGYHQRILVNTDNMIIGGHSRKKALLAAGFRECDAIEVLKASRLLSEYEFKRLNIRDNLSFGEFDFDILANHFDMKDLEEWGLDLKLFPTIEMPEIEKEEEKDENKVTCELCGK